MYGVCVDYVSYNECNTCTPLYMSHQLAKRTHKQTGTPCVYIPACLSAAVLATSLTCLLRVCLSPAGQSVVVIVVIHNTGNVRLRGIEITTTPNRTSTAGAALSSFVCTGGSSSSLPASLNVSSSMTCTATYSFGEVTDVEAGDISFATSVSAAPSGQPVTASASTVVVAVMNLPGVDLVLDTTTCDAPDSAGEGVLPSRLNMMVWSCHMTPDHITPHLI